MSPSPESDVTDVGKKREIEKKAVTNQRDDRRVVPPPSEESSMNVSHERPESRPKRNAFAELMSPKAKRANLDLASRPSRGLPGRPFSGRDALGAYTASPASIAPSQVLYYNENFVAIKDMYPKSVIHTLLLPRSPLSRLHPVDAFEDRDFLAAVRDETAKLKQIVAKELQRRHGQKSRQDQIRKLALEQGDKQGDKNDNEAPPGRDWEKEILVGIHAGPSMNDLHVHVLSRDMVSETMRHRKHYQSFQTPFLVDLADFPLAPDDPRRHPGSAGYLKRDLVCWRCGQNFGNQFAKLKTHLAEEFKEWVLE